MKRPVIALLFGLLFIPALLFGVYLQFAPSITVSNNAENALVQALVWLPTSRLDFGRIDTGQKNKLFYSTQTDATRIKYQLIVSDGSELRGDCPLNKSLLNPKTTISLDSQQGVTCGP